MLLACRPAHLSELATLFQTFGIPSAYGRDIRAQVASIWEQCARQGSLITTVFEDVSRQQVVGVSIEVFVTDTFLAEILARPTSQLREQVIRRELMGQSVVLTLEQAQQANTQQGLNLFFLNDPLPPRPLSPEEFRAVDAKWGDVLYDYRACRLQSIIWECYDQQALDMGLSCGMKVFPGQNPVATPDRPCLTTITREQALDQYGTHVSQMFMYAPARFTFTSGQQELLRQALMGATDEELAQSLYLSLSAIKKRWVAIYDRVRLTMPWLLPEDDDETRQTRGTEKRRHLLSYLREHPEELHPINGMG